MPILRGVCGFTTKVFYAHTAGAIGVIVVNSNDIALQMTAPDGLDYSSLIPSIAVSNSDGMVLSSLLAAGEAVRVSIGVATSYRLLPFEHRVLRTEVTEWAEESIDSGSVSVNEGVVEGCYSHRYLVPFCLISPT